MIKVSNKKDNTKDDANKTNVSSKVSFKADNSASGSIDVRANSSGKGANNNRGIIKGYCINCAQINLNKGKSSTNELRRILREKRTDVCFIQEPNIRGGNIIGFGGGESLFYKGTGKPQTAIIVQGKGKIRGTLIANKSCDLITVVEITHAKGRFYAVSAYIPPRENGADCFRETITKIGEIIMGLEGEVLIGADSNSRSPLWGSAGEDARGRKVAELLENRDLFIMNEKKSKKIYSEKFLFQIKARQAK